MMKKKDFGKSPFSGKCLYCKKPGHDEFVCRKKQADEGRGQNRTGDARFRVHDFECDKQIGMACRLRCKLANDLCPGQV